MLNERNIASPYQPVTPTPMTSTAIKQFIKLRNQLTQERTQIAARLKEVEAALGSFQSPSPTPKTSGKKRRPKPGSKRKVSNEMSLKEAIVKVLGKQMMTKEEILAGVQKLGYRFRTSKPIGTVTVVLYGSKNPKFKRQDGKFGVV
jgi:hypothetical protein